MPSKKRLGSFGKKKKPVRQAQVLYQEPDITPLLVWLPYQFIDQTHLKQALTHSSMGYELRKRLPDNQRLEFLGDAVLQLALSTKLYELFPNDGEGMLTKLRTRLVQAAALARVARDLDLGSYLLLSRGEESNGGRERENILADAMEAIIGAVHIDGGYEAAASFISVLWEKEISIIKEAPVEQNPKGQLQEILQEQSGLSPSYRIVDSIGPDHLKSFCAVVSWNGLDLGQGMGKSKKEAQTAAAVEALHSPTILSLKTSKSKHPVSKYASK